MFELDDGGVLRLVERDVCDVAVVLEVFREGGDAEIGRGDVFDLHAAEGSFVH